MTTYQVRLPTALLIKITAGLVLFFGILCGAHAGGGTRRSSLNRAKRRKSANAEDTGASTPVARSGPSALKS